MKVANPVSWNLNPTPALSPNFVPLAPFLEARYHYVFSGDSFNNNNSGSSAFQMVPISIGLTF
jgi:hypothetical protein